MFSYMKGKIAELNLDYLILENNNIGYNITISSNAYNVFLGKEDALVYTELIVREDSLTIYGFLDREELDTFKLLQSVSKIGPKVAIGVLSKYTPKQIKQYISNEDANMLSKAPGLGSKTSQRIILELKDKISISEEDMIDEKSYYGEIGEESEVVSALVNLGYNKNEVIKAIRNKDLTNKSIEEAIKIALVEMGGF